MTLTAVELQWIRRQLGMLPFDVVAPIIGFLKMKESQGAQAAAQVPDDAR